MCHFECHGLKCIEMNWRNDPDSGNINILKIKYRRKSRTMGKNSSGQRILLSVTTEKTQIKIRIGQEIGFGINWLKLMVYFYENVWMETPGIFLKIEECYFWFIQKFVLKLYRLINHQIEISHIIAIIWSTINQVSLETFRFPTHAL